MEVTRITSRKNETLLRLKKLGQSRSERYAQREFIADGVKLLREACAHNASVLTVVCSEIPDVKLPDSARVILVPADVLRSISPLDTAQSVVFSCAMPETRPGELPEQMLFLEDIQDPGNVGTILRSANAFSCGAVAFVGACADPYSPKTLRASMGAVFRQRFMTMTHSEVADYVASGRQIYAAALGDNVSPLHKADLSRAGVALGSEGHGLSREMMDICTGSILIPMAPECESLNVSAAAAVLLWEMKKQREA